MTPWRHTHDASEYRCRAEDMTKDQMTAEFNRIAQGISYHKDVPRHSLGLTDEGQYNLTKLEDQRDILRRICDARPKS